MDFFTGLMLRMLKKSKFSKQRFFVVIFMSLQSSLFGDFKSALTFAVRCRGEEKNGNNWFGAIKRARFFYLFYNNS